MSTQHSSESHKEHPPLQHPFCLQTHDEVLSALQSRVEGLRTEEVDTFRERHGYNELPEGAQKSVLVTFLEQFQNPLIYVLLIAVAILFYKKDLADALIVLGVLLANAVIGTVQEGRAQQALKALKKLSNTNATVLRDGENVVLPDREVVPGDILVLKEGEGVSADARILRAHEFRVSEAVLTGESEPVNKTGEVLEDVEVVEDERGGVSVPIFSQRNMVFKGTYVTGGSAMAVIVGTGVRTAIGAISQEIAGIDKEIPLKKNVELLSRQIIGVVLVLSAFLLIYGGLRGEEITVMFATAVSLAVSVIPEGLPVVLTYVLARGVWHMSKRNVLVKKLQAVEALGQANVVAVDKTGTITKNELAVKEVWANDRLYEVNGSGYDFKGAVLLEGKTLKGADLSRLDWLGRTSAFCAGATVHPHEDGKGYRVLGDPTEAALLVFAGKLGISKEELEDCYELVEDHGFNYETKLRQVVHKFRGKYLLSVTGAPEAVFSRVHLTEAQHEKATEVQHEMAAQGLRVIGAAHALLEKKPNLTTKHPLVLDGLVGMQDSIHEGVKTAVQKLQLTNIRVVMITGDHARTAEAIARQAGIFRKGDLVLTGQEIEHMSPDELAEAVKEVSVFARVTPEHKMHIVQAFKRAGLVVAMTGDGVNDAPSLVAADLGISMGQRGTEVAKEASDLVLLDDNFKGIVAAVEEGRGIYLSIQRVLTYLLSGSSSLVLTILVAILLLWPVPLLPSQIIWLNFVTDVFLVLALVSERNEGGLLSRTYHHPKALLTRPIIIRALTLATPMAVGTLILYSRYYEVDIDKARTMVVSGLSAFHWANAWNVRSDYASVFTVRRLFTNKPLIAVTLSVVLLQMGAVYLPAMNAVLHTVPLSLNDWGLILLLAIPVIALEEVRKLVVRARMQRPHERGVENVSLAAARS